MALRERMIIAVQDALDRGVTDGKIIFLPDGSAGKWYPADAYGFPRGSKRVKLRAGVTAEALVNKTLTKRKKSLPKVVSREDAARIVCAPDPLCPSGLRNRVALQLLYRCGLRVGEVCNLQPRHVDLKQGYVAILDGKDTTGSGGKDRNVPLDPDTALWCQRWFDQRPRSKWFLSSMRSDVRGGRISECYMRQLLRRLSHELGIYLPNGKPVHPHTLRHCYCTEKLEDGYHIREVADLAGHEDISTTQIYLSVRPGALAAKIRNTPPVSSYLDAAQAEKLERKLRKLAPVAGA